MALQLTQSQTRLLAGGCIGRVVGELVDLIPAFDGHMSDPGVYAAIGAAAALGGFTRSTIAVVATITEVTGDVSIIAPVIDNIFRID